VSDIGRLLEPAGFVGAYLHGSLAFGCFFSPKSDIDIVFVVEQNMPAELRRTVALAMCDWSDKRTIVGDIEISVLRRADTFDFKHPLPYELHYGESHKDAIRDGTITFEGDQSDPDLAVYCRVIRERGICLSGAPIEVVFGAVPVEFYKESIIEDLEWIIEDDHVTETPFYCVLNCCRVLMANSVGWERILNKDEGGEWALANLPAEHHAIIAQALACYRSDEHVDPSMRRTHGHDWDLEALRAFRDYVRDRVQLSTSGEHY